MLSSFLGKIFSERKVKRQIKKVLGTQGNVTIFADAYYISIGQVLHKEDCRKC